MAGRTLLFHAEDSEQQVYAGWCVLIVRLLGIRKLGSTTAGLVRRPLVVTRGRWSAENAKITVWTSLEQSIVQNFRKLLHNRLSTV